MRPAVRETYGPVDLGNLPIFAGGFINFGHWHGINLTPDRPLTETDRIRSQKDLYRLVLDAAALPKAPTVLEVGCGLGTGCALTVREHDGATVTGMDIHPDQLTRARAAQAELLRGEPLDGNPRHDGPRPLRFVQGAAERMPLPDGGFDAVVSVEAAQHFPDLTAFARETARVLRPGGRMAVTSFFTTDAAPGRPAELAALLDTFANGLDIAHPVTALTDAATAAGLTDVRATSIGADVWPGWDRWLSRWWDPGTWPRNFLAAYEQGILDYYLVTADKRG
ncbi:class I SAM-dependent methyltransferase [Streptacidiphilus sp. NEAU-YB345]|uniref:Class I SAM-dependent methyltransferase n=2 Tax=Streptacidiphilus fuscans TaxID=2789292 RepID=A0A931FG08_9ACTN|nr:class I SAM-dependent methyltransferase [Streptacidiphilus fuscans]MBF9073412.1 class I SAM-dependent methyltransferase [Streptacidiphilus fuscans]